MNNKISEILKKLTISILLLVFSFVLLTPTVNALEYDPKKRRQVIEPKGDIDPWEEFEIYDPPPDDYERPLLSMKSLIIGFTTYFSYKLGWDWNSDFNNKQTNNVYITTPDDCDKDSKQTFNNR